MIFFTQKVGSFFGYVQKTDFQGGKKIVIFLINFLDELGNSKNIIFFLQEKILVLFLAMFISMTFRGEKKLSFFWMKQEFLRTLAEQGPLQAISPMTKVAGGGAPPGHFYDDKHGTQGPPPSHVLLIKWVPKSSTAQARSDVQCDFMGWAPGLGLWFSVIIWEGAQFFHVFELLYKNRWGKV